MAIKTGDNVTLDYEGKFESGEVFDSSNHGDHSHPLTFKVGSGQVIKGFDDAVIGMEVGQEKKFTIKPEEAYGIRDERLVQKVPRTMLPPELDIKEGMDLMVGSPDGQAMPVRVSKVEKDEVTLDLNHPMSGKTLIFTIKIVKVN